MTADGNHRHETISDVAIAEMEAGIYGLQVENYYLDGFMRDLILIISSQHMMDA